MGWFWGSSDGKPSDKKQDPLKSLDPALRDFLKNESPIKYEVSKPQLEKPTATSKPAQTPASRPDASNTTQISEKPLKPKVPPQSLFQDGRYADIWESYRPQVEIEEENKSDQEKMMDVIDGYKYRKAEIGRAALENCALEQWDVNLCFQYGGFADKLTMCRTENRKLDRCYVMQSKFLKALGYLSILDRPPEIDEKIQMHADTLYHRMLDQEKQIEAAKAEGKPIPTFPPLVSSVPATQKKPLAKADDEQLDLAPDMQELLNKRLEGLSPEERDIEERAFRAEIRSGVEVAEHYTWFLAKQDAERRKRKDEGRETIGDKVTSLLRFRPDFEVPKKTTEQKTIEQNSTDGKSKLEDIGKR
ncbi:hypothetical protein B0O99DRAFT_513253 [Bisporella sp. PMI_857]|nr:hypothetical protein B0O99DRAFT_513253 [Bisporella sp. PMI_857]